MIKTEAQINQNIFDIALLNYGNADAVFDIARLNQWSDGINHTLTPGEKIMIKPFSNDITNYFKGKSIATLDIPIRGIGFSPIETGFFAFSIDDEFYFGIDNYNIEISDPIFTIE